MANKTEAIRFRISEKEKEEIRNKAEQMQMSISEYILFLIRKDIHQADK